jgi:hypothetical protein
MSAVPPKADMCAAFIHVCFGPIADIQEFGSVLPHYITNARLAG